MTDDTSTERVSAPKRGRRKTPSAQAVEDWANVLFGIANRAIGGLTRYALLIYCGIEVLNPDLLSQHPIKPEIAQFLFYGLLAQFGVKIVGEGIIKR
jgi:hypothetical protein